MRNVLSPQLSLGQIDIADIVIDVTSRDDIPLLLLGLQHLYCTRPLRDAIFGILKELVPIQTDGEQTRVVSLDKGRPGMEQWAILVLGTLRLALNADYDRILELANEHKTLRDMLGHTGLESDFRYRLQTLRDNLRLFTPELMARINAEVVRAGHQALGLSAQAPLHGRCDSFVVETQVHFPTDLNLLHDAIRKLIQGCGQWNDTYPSLGWRQHDYNLRQFKRHYRAVQTLKHSTSKDEAKQATRQEEIHQACRSYLDLAQSFLERARITLSCLHTQHRGPVEMLASLEVFGRDAERQIDQIRRRILQGETIPHDEKVFSLFQQHTEWISKGNQEDLKGLLDTVVLPKKGRLSKADQAREHALEFKRLRRQHSAVESAINALEVHGLDVCRDHGLDGFKRYVALAVLSRNIQQLGAIKREQARQRLVEQRKRAA